MKMDHRSWRNILLRCAVAPLLVMQLALNSPAQADESVLAPGARLAGKTIGEWTGAWWRSAMESLDFPFLAGGSQPGGLGTVKGPVFFAVASPGPGDTTYTYAVPRGKYLLLPLYTYNWAVQTLSDPCSTEECARRLADRFVHATKSMKVRIDGEPVHNLFRHYETTPDFFLASVPVDGWWASGDATSAGIWYGISSGYWLMLEPLRAGKHVVSVEVTAAFSSVCADGSTSCDIPRPGAAELSTTTLILTVPCERREGGRREEERCGRD
jgi:hypothetical protein